MTSIEKRRLKVHTMLYHRRFSDESQSNNLTAVMDDSTLPFQIVNPTGSIGIGLPLLQVNNNIREDNGSTYRHVVLASKPIDSPFNRNIRFTLQLWFSVIFLLDLFYTCLLYMYADSIDNSLLQPNSASPPVTLQKISNQRQKNEIIYFVCNLCILILGELSILFENVLGLSIFVISILYNFFFGIPNLPYFAYGSKFILDFILLFLSIQLRFKLMANYLPVRVYGRHIR